MPIPTSAYSPRIHFFKELRGFDVSTARDITELREALRLRYEVYYQEWKGEAEDDGNTLDQDELDLYCDHILVRNRKDGLLIATFRFNPIHDDGPVYSTHEFTLDRFLGLHGDKLELGRACIRKEWRNNMAVLVLYNGIKTYLDTAKPTFLFGCSSVAAREPADAALISRWIHQIDKQVDPALGIMPQPEHLLDGFDAALADTPEFLSKADCKRAEEMLPPLLRTYLKAGARLSPVPAYDPEFDCVDFFTVLDNREGDEAYMDRYRPS